MMKKYLQYVLMGIAVFALVVTAGCGSQTNGKGAADNSSSSSVQAESTAPASSASSSSDTQKKDKKLTIKVYYPNDQGTKLIAVKRTVTLDQQEKYTAAMESLMEGTTEKGQTNIIPKQAKLKSVKVANGTATVDFSQELKKNFVGGSTGETMLVGSIVDTLTEFPEVKQVQILIEGKKVETLGGHMDLTQPLTRMNDLLK